MKSVSKPGQHVSQSNAQSQDESALHASSEPATESRSTRHEAAKALQQLKSRFRLSARKPSLPSPFAIAGEAWLDKKSTPAPVTIAISDLHGRAVGSSMPDIDPMPKPAAFTLRRVDELEIEIDSTGQPAAQVDATPVFSRAGARFASMDRQMIDPARRCHTLVTRWKEMPRETPEENSRYGNFMAKSVQQAAHDMSSGRIDNLDQLWHCARQARLDGFLVQKQVATPEQLVGEDAEFFRRASVQRHGSPLTTKMSGRYGYIKHSIHARVQEVFRNGTRISPNEWTCGSMALFHNTFERNWGPDTYQLRISAPDMPPQEKQQPVFWNIDTARSTGAPGDFENAASVTVRELVNPMVVDAVTADNFVDTYSYARAQTSIIQALQAGGRDDILDHAFEAYWTLVVVAPDARGSAAKSHFVLQTMLLAKGIDLPPARAGLAPDLEAMSHSRDAWLVRAREVFDIK